MKDAFGDGGTYFGVARVPSKGLPGRGPGYWVVEFKDMGVYEPHILHWLRGPYPTDADARMTIAPQFVRIVVS